MELIQANPTTLNNHEPINALSNGALLISSAKPFIEANTIESSLDEIKEHHIIPVFIKDNEPLISQADFIQAMADITKSVYPDETILQPNIRLSHPIKGRVPDAKYKPASELLDSEKTLYYERMAFVIEIPTVYDEIEGSRLSLMVGGVKSLNQDNLYNRKGADEHFKIFVGFKNTVCTNLCVWTDGYMNDVCVSNLGQLRACIQTMLANYNSCYHLHALRQLEQYSLTEQQFAILIGRCRMYQHLPKSLQADIPALSLGDSQLNSVVKDYYRDDSFCKMANGNINLWRLYNLFTGANKTTYIDNFMDRAVNAFHFVEQIKNALSNERSNWFFN